jgi:hypothetical protein
MNDPLQPAGFLQTAFIQAEGELRSKASFRCEYFIAIPTGSELAIVGAVNRWLIRYPM